MSASLKLRDPVALPDTISLPGDRPPLPTRPTRTAGPSSRGRRGGFTLIELAVVIVVAGLILTLVVPQFRARTHADLKRSALKLAATIEHTFQQSAFRQETLRLHFDLEHARYWIDRWVEPTIGEAGPTDLKLEDDPEGLYSGADSEADQEEGHYETDRKILPDPVDFPEDVFIASVTTQYIEEITKGEAFVHFFPDGYAEPAVIYLGDARKGEYTLFVSPLSGKVKVLPGHHEFDVNMKEEKQ
jgi:general secretion pathway protein H